jgi:hypothetical protein
MSKGSVTNKMLGVGDPPDAAWYAGIQQQQASALANAYNTVRNQENLYATYMGLARLSQPTPPVSSVPSVPANPTPCKPQDPTVARFLGLIWDK